MSDSAQNGASSTILAFQKVIIDRWQTRVRETLSAARSEHSSIIINTLPDFLKFIADSLRPGAGQAEALKNSTLAQAHGRERAHITRYTVGQVITEYRILREVLLGVAEERCPFTLQERNVVHALIDHAIADAVTAYTEVYSDLQEQFTAVLTHDLRNPLSAARSTAQMILRYPDRTDRHLQFAGRIVDNLDQMNRMIEDLLDASRLRGGEKLPLVLLELDLRPLLRRVLDDFEMSYGDRFRLKVDGTISGHWDEDLLRRAIANLVNNAVKYGDANGKVTVRARNQDGHAVIEVHNYGNPIPPDDLKSLFKTYKRTSGAQTGGKKGWGLGLSLVRGVAEVHGGTVAVTSTPEDGTTFMLDLLLDPRVAPQSMPPKTE